MIYRIDVRSRGTDSTGQSLRQQIAEFGFKVGPIATSRVFLIESDADRNAIERISNQLLADPVVETFEIFNRNVTATGLSRIEVHLKPGVMDPVAASTEMAINDLGISVRQVRTGRAFVIEGEIPRKDLQQIAQRVLANGVIESVHFEAYCPKQFETLGQDKFQLRHVDMLELSDEQLTKLSREGHLFLSLAEMKAIQTYFREQKREPSDIELETLAQTWSEHCVHKTLKSAVEIEELDPSGKTLETRRYGNLIRDTIFASTMKLMKSAPGKDFCLSVFKDNAGVVVFDETDAVCFKVETHNHPSAIEPYGGSATGAGGVIRDVLGTGLAAKPIANTDIFCVAYPDAQSLPKGVIHPKRVLQQVVAGVRDYGNRMGIPTVNGAVYFDNKYLGNPLVFCGCVGLIPRNRIDKAARPGDAIVVMGGRTGRDGIHGATFSSAELTDTHADEFSHAVQIGNAITEKKMADVILAARDRELFTGITDCGAGGLSSAIGEMGEKTGAMVHLEKVPLKYAGLRYDEIWISEAQERMVLSVPAKNVPEILRMAQNENVEATVIGTFGTENSALVLQYKGVEVGRLAMEFLHNGIPMPTRRAVVAASTTALPQSTIEGDKKQLSQSEIPAELLRLLAHPNIASKHWIIRQYDHEVQGGSVVKPLIGPRQIGPSDAAVIRPKLDSYRGVALGCGFVPAIDDAYQMSLASIDEAIRNVVSVGADPDQMAILDNFCWPSVDDEITMGTLVRACEACHDAALAYGIPFISGKDSLHNQFTNQETGEVLRIPRTLLISAIGVITDVRKCITMDLKKPGSKLSLFRTKDKSPAALAKLHRALHQEILAGTILSCHDVSNGGVLVAAAEMCIASGLGLDIRSGSIPYGPFTEIVGEYLIETLKAIQISHAEVIALANVISNGEISDKSAGWRISVEDMIKAWRGTLDW